jgi:hypothetical protein
MNWILFIGLFLFLYITYLFMLFILYLNISLVELVWYEEEQNEKKRMRKL